MVYVYENLTEYSEQLYEQHLNSLPEWRRTYALRYKQHEDRKRSVLAFVLLREALKKEFGIQAEEFVYNGFGKPFLKGTDISFSLSHCKSAVACAVSRGEIGIDVETVRDFDEKVATRFLNEAKRPLLNSVPADKELFFELWTKKEAISKFEGKGLSLLLKSLDLDSYLLHSEKRKDFVLSVCYGKKPPEGESAPKAPAVITVAKAL